MRARLRTAFSLRWKTCSKLLLSRLDAYVLQPERLDETRARQLLGQQRGHVAKLGLRALGDAVQPLADRRNRNCRDRIDAEHDQRHQPVQVEHRRDERENHERVAHGRVERGLGRLLDERKVVGELGDEPSGRIARQPREVRADQMRERQLLHVGRLAHDDTVGLDRLQVEKERAQHGDADDGAEHVEQRALLLLHQRVERRLDDHRVGARRRGEHRGQQQREQQLAPARRDPLAGEPLEQPQLLRVDGERPRGALGGRVGLVAHGFALASAGSGWSGSRRRCMWTMK